jgi:hypothetical protein
VYAPDQGSTFEEWFTGELGNLKASRANEKGVFLF